MVVHEVPSASGASLNYTNEKCGISTEDLRELLTEWMTSEKSVPRDAFTCQPKILQRKFPALPSTSKTLLSTKVEYCIYHIILWRVCYVLNWEQGLMNCMNALPQLEV